MCKFSDSTHTCSRHSFVKKLSLYFFVILFQIPGSLDAVNKSKDSTATQNMKNLSLGVKIETQKLVMKEEFKCSVNDIYEVLTDPQVSQQLG